MKHEDELKGILELLTKDSKGQIEWESFKPTRTNGILIFLIESVLELNEKEKKPTPVEDLIEATDLHLIKRERIKVIREKIEQNEKQY